MSSTAPADKTNTAEAQPEASKAPQLGALEEDDEFEEDDLSPKGGQGGQGPPLGGGGPPAGRGGGDDAESFDLYQSLLGPGRFYELKE